MTMTGESSEYFKQVAEEWDNIRAGYFGDGVRDAAIAKAYLRPEMAVADIGAGTGFISAGLAPLVKRVYVVDASPEMLKVAERNLASFDNIEFHEADGLSLPFPDDSLDAVFANMYLHHAADPLAAIRAMVRVPRPGGRLVVLDFGRPDNALWRRLYFAYLRRLVPCLGWLFCGSASAYAYILESLQHYPAQHGVAAAMRGHGLANVRVLSLLGGVMAINYGEKPGPSLSPCQGRNGLARMPG